MGARVPGPNGTTRHFVRLAGHLRRYLRVGAVHMQADDRKLPNARQRFRDLDERMARAAGHRTVPAPPTYGFSLMMHADQGFKVHEDLGIDKARTVHGEQGFVYYRPIYAGDVVTDRQRIVDTYEKKGGACSSSSFGVPRRRDSVSTLSTD